jgi:hypothetical protein
MAEHRSCGRCGYDLRGLLRRGACPECGLGYDDGWSEGNTRDRRRRLFERLDRLAAVLLVIVLAIVIFSAFVGVWL